MLAFGFIFEVKLEVEEGAFPAKNRHYYPPPPTTGTAAGYWNSRRLLELLERRIAAIRVRVCDGNAMNVR